MFAKFAIFAASVAAFVAASPLPGDSSSGISNSCNTGSMHCCNSVQDVKSSQVTLVAGLLGVVFGDETGQAGLTCSPLTAAGLAGNSWFAMFTFSIRRDRLTPFSALPNQPAALVKATVSFP